jgi:hypothetical protein
MYNEKELRNKSKKDLIEMLLKLDVNGSSDSESESEFLSLEGILSTVDERIVLDLNELFSSSYANVNIIEKYVNFISTYQENKINLLFDFENIKEYIKGIAEKINYLGSVTNRKNDAFKMLQKNGYDCWIVIISNTEGEREEDSVAQNNYVLLFENEEFSELVLFRTHYDSWSGINGYKFDDKEYYKIIKESDFKVRLDLF